MFTLYIIYSPTFCLCLYLSVCPLVRAQCHMSFNPRDIHLSHLDVALCASSKQQNVVRVSGYCWYRRELRVAMMQSQELSEQTTPINIPKTHPTSSTR